MKRWLTALFAVLFLSTATLHVLEHVGGTDSACAVCAVQQSGAAGMAAPAAVAVPVPVIELPSVVLPAAPVFFRAAAPARGPPALPA